MLHSLQHSATIQIRDPMPKARPGWLTFTQAAAKLDIDRSTLWRWRDANRWGLADRVRFLKLGRETFVNESDLDAWDAARWGESEAK